jgi:hypothetical protein
MNKSKKLTLRTSTIRTLDLRRVTGGNIGNTGNTIGVPESHFCGGGGGQEGTKGVPCWDSFVCYSVDC